MTEIAILLLVGTLLFFAFLKLALQGPPASAPDSTAVMAVKQMVHLDGLSFPGAQRLLNPTELEMLESTPELQAVARAFRKERRTMALLWVGLLLEDVHRLWQFRRFLVRNGVQAKLGEELQILEAAIMAVLFLNFLRVSLHLAGPFVLVGAAARARRVVEKMSNASAGVLDRMPRAGWPEIERTWLNSLA